MNYKTVKNPSEFSLTEKKSEFIGACAPVKTEREAVDFINSVKKKHSAAKHNVYAYVLREGFAQRYSDDGEPHGTAGMPVLDSIRKAGVTDAVVVVTRYFGGVLLGTGGLVRAYTAAASGALSAAGVAEMSLFSLFELKAGYSDYQKIMPFISSCGASLKSSDFSEDVLLEIAVRTEFENSFLSSITDITNGRVVAKKTGEKCDFI